MENILEVTGLNKTYPNFSLKDVSFSLPDGCITGFIGKNGAGKTTTLKSILDLVPRISGGIKWFGMDLYTHAKEKTVSYKIPVILFLILSICLGIYFPIQFKLGYERTKMFFVVVIMASPIGFAQFLKITKNLNIEFLSNITPALLLIGSLLVSVVILIISSVISIKIYSKAELA